METINKSILLHYPAMGQDYVCKIYQLDGKYTSVTIACPDTNQKVCIYGTENILLIAELIQKELGGK